MITFSIKILSQKKLIIMNNDLAILHENTMKIKFNSSLSYKNEITVSFNSVTN